MNSKGLSDLAILAIIVVSSVIIGFSIVEYKDSNSDPYTESGNSPTYQPTYQPSEVKQCEADYQLCDGTCYKCVEGYYLDSSCKCQPDEDTQRKIEIIEEWNINYKVTLEEDVSKINEIRNKYANVQDIKQWNNLVAELDPRFQIYYTHLIEAKSFINTYSSYFENGDELKRNVDNQLVQLQTNINLLNNAINTYNEQIMQQKSEQEALYNALKILAGFI